MKHRPFPISYKTKQDDPNANTVTVKHQIKRREWRRQRLSDVMRTQGSQEVVKSEKSKRKVKIKRRRESYLIRENE